MGQLVSSILVKTEIKNQVSAIREVYLPAPVTNQLDGLRVKLNYDRHHEEIANMSVSGYKLGDIADIKRFMMYGYILVKLLPESSIIQ
ncbi:MAG: methyl-coenzyme M reductase family protein [Methanothermobacter sp.]|nr:methyl-coenzyme M reductase family protein [Methanothermobacter sp.]